MSLRAEIAVIDDDENVVGIVKVPLFKSDARTFDRGPFAENMVTDPATGEVYKFTFQADLAGQIAPKREGSKVPEVGDFVRVIGRKSLHVFHVDALVEVNEVTPAGNIYATGAGRDGKTVIGFVHRDDYILE